MPVRRAQGSGGAADDSSRSGEEAMQYGSVQGHDEGAGPRVVLRHARRHGVSTQAEQYTKEKGLSTSIVHQSMSFTN